MLTPNIWTSNALSTKRIDLALNCSFEKQMYPFKLYNVFLNLLSSLDRFIGFTRAILYIRSLMLYFFKRNDLNFSISSFVASGLSPFM